MTTQTQTPAATSPAADTKYDRPIHVWTLDELARSYGGQYTYVRSATGGYVAKEVPQALEIVRQMDHTDAMVKADNVCLRSHTYILARETDASPLGCSRNWLIVNCGGGTSYLHLGWGRGAEVVAQMLETMPARDAFWLAQMTEETARAGYREGHERARVDVLLAKVNGTLAFPRRHGRISLDLNAKKKTRAAAPAVAPAPEAPEARDPAPAVEPVAPAVTAPVIEEFAGPSYGGKLGIVIGLTAQDISETLGFVPDYDAESEGDGKVTIEWKFTVGGVKCSTWDWKGSADADVPYFSFNGPHAVAQYLFAGHYRTNEEDMAIVKAEIEADEAVYLQEKADSMAAVDAAMAHSDARNAARDEAYPEEETSPAVARRPRKARLTKMEKCHEGVRAELDRRRVVENLYTSMPDATPAERAAAALSMAVDAATVCVAHNRAWGGDGVTPAEMVAAIEEAREVARLMMICQASGDTSGCLFRLATACVDELERRAVADAPVPASVPARDPAPAVTVVTAPKIARDNKELCGGKKGVLQGVTPAYISLVLGLSPDEVVGEPSKVTMSWHFTFQGLPCGVWDWKGSADYSVPQFTFSGPLEVAEYLFAGHVWTMGQEQAWLEQEWARDDAAESEAARRAAIVAQGKATQARANDRWAASLEQKARDAGLAVNVDAMALRKREERAAIERLAVRFWNANEGAITRGYALLGEEAPMPYAGSYTNFVDVVVDALSSLNNAQFPEGRRMASGWATHRAAGLLKGHERAHVKMRGFIRDAVAAHEAQDA